MVINRKDILSKTHYGLNIYSYVLRQYYPDEIVIHLSGKQCKPAKNPFLSGEPILNIFNKDWVFYFEDTTDKNFNGDPFDFAAYYFKLTGNELYVKLNEVLHLHIGKKNPFYGNKDRISPLEINIPKRNVVIPKFSYFIHPVTNTKPYKEVNLLEIYKLVGSEQFLKQTESLRSISDKAKARKYKAKNFDYVTFSGTFSERNDNALQTHSGLLTIDFDHIVNIDELKQALFNDKFFDTELLFVSPSGDGLKWIIPVDVTEFSHADYFKAVSNYIQQTYEIEVDKSGKDVSRACFLPYDNEVYINPKYLQ